MHDPHFAPDLREISAILSRTALKTPRRVFVATIAIVHRDGHRDRGRRPSVSRRAASRRARASSSWAKRPRTPAGRAAALEHYRAALALDRDGAEYRRALAIALISLRRTAEAETHLDTAPRARSGRRRDEPAARAHRRRPRPRSPKPKRSISARSTAAGPPAPDGRTAARRLAARFELIEWLVQMGAIAPARAEQLRLQAEVPDVPFLQLELARADARARPAGPGRRHPAPRAGAASRRCVGRRRSRQRPRWTWAASSKPAPPRAAR